MPDHEESIDEVLVHLQYIRASQERTEAHLRTLNGRTAIVETKIAVLEDRNPGASGKQAGLISAIVAGAIAGLAAVFGK